MATMNEMLATLNAARVNNGKTPLASFKKAKAELQRMIDAEHAAAPTIDDNAAAITSGMTRTAVDKLDTTIQPRRDGNVLKQPLIEPKIVKAASVLATSFGNWLRANGISGKIARARLRRAGVTKAADGHYALNEYTMAITSGKATSNKADVA